MLCKTINIYCCFKPLWFGIICYAAIETVSLLHFSTVPCVSAQQSLPPIVYRLVCLFPYPKDILRAETQQFIFISNRVPVSLVGQRRGDCGWEARDGSLAQPTRKQPSSHVCICKNALFTLTKALYGPGGLLGSWKPGLRYLPRFKGRSLSGLLLATVVLTRLLLRDNLYHSHLVVSCIGHAFKQNSVASWHSLMSHTWLRSPTRPSMPHPGGFLSHDAAAYILRALRQSNTYAPCYYKCGPCNGCYVHQISVTDERWNF